MKKRGKKYNEIMKKISIKEETDLITAISQVITRNTSKFNGKIDLHVKIKKNDKKDKQPVRGSVSMPNQFGKSKKVIVFTNDPAKIELAKKLGAIEAGSDDLIKKISGGWLDFDVAISEPDMMIKIASVAKILGPKGLMPNPKNGTVTTEIEKTIGLYQGGKVDFKVDKDNIIHISVGTIDMSKESIEQNIKATMKAINSAIGKPILISVDSIHIAPTMGPSVKISKSSF